MATTAGRGSSVKRENELADEAARVVRDQVEELARLEARQMLLVALEDEVNVYLGRGWYERRGDAGPPGHGRREFRGYRNGTTPRRLTLGSGTVALDVPRVRDIPAGQEAFESRVLRKYQRRSDTIDETFMRLFIEGLATRDFEPTLRLRTNAARRFKKTNSGVCLVHQVLVRLSQTWRHLRAADLCNQVPLPTTRKVKAKTKAHAAWTSVTDAHEISLHSN